jgi:hypothetical protein
MRTTRALTAIAVLVLGVTWVATAASAPPAGVVGAQSRTIPAAEIRAAARVNGQDAATDAAIAGHVQAQAASGRLLDAKNVVAAVFGDAQATWEAGSQVTELRIDRALSRNVKPEFAAPGAQGEILELTMLSGEDPEAAADAPQAAAVVGAGMLSASYTGGTRLTSACQTWTVSGRSVTGCYQKFKPNTDGSSTRDYYAYNRWATAVGENHTFVPDVVPVVVDARSRPWAGYGGRIVGMTDYFPTSGSELCNEGSSVNVGVGSLSLSFGLRNCGDKYPIPNATTRTMGVIYDDGFIFGGPVAKGVDFEMEVFNWQGGATPIFGDYNYGKFCQWTLLDCTGTLGKNGW